MKSFIADKNRKLSKLALYHIEDLSFSTFMKALRKKDVKVNGKRVSQDVTLSVGDKVEIYYVENVQTKFEIVYKDQNVLVVDKKKGYTSENVFDEVKAQFSTASFIHRLDRNTSGLMIFALSEDAEKELLYGFKNRTFEKYYTATVVGVPKIKERLLTAYLKKDAEKATVTILDTRTNGATLIKTGYKVISDDGETAKLRVVLHTGKTHQIRAHLAHIGHPIVGDGKYGDYAFNERYGAKTQMLCASELVLHFSAQTQLAYLDGKSFLSKQ